MTNSTDELVQTLADSFLEWFHNDILPVCTVIYDLLIIIIGIILNIMLIVTFRKKGLFNEPSTHFVFVMCILDFVAYALLLVPNVITAIAGKWLLSQPVCEFHGAMLGFLMFAQFLTLIALSIERALKLLNSTAKYYEVLFENKRSVYIATGVLLGLAFVIAFIPVTGAGDIKYDFYHQGCMLDYAKGHAFLIVHFILTVVSSFASFLVCFILIFNERRNTLIKNRLEINKKKLLPSDKKSQTSVVNDSSLPTIDEADDTVFDETSCDQEKIVKAPEANKPTSNAFERKTSRPRSRPKSPQSQSLLFEIFSDDEENPAFHLSITYLSLWGVIMLCYCPYFLLNFYDVFNSVSVWEGFYTLTLLIMHTSFVAKPVIYIGHNRHLRKVTKETLPQAIRNRARSVRKSITTVTNKMEDFIFKSNANKRFRATLAAQKAVLVWKKKSKKTNGILKLKDSAANNLGLSNDENQEQPKSIILNKDANIPIIDTENPPVSHKTVGFTDKTSRHVDDRLLSTVTPSAIEVAPASSFIEKERQRLMGINGNISRTDNTNIQMNNISVAEDSITEAVPGMIGGNDGN